jgi:pimeloyl-ACP methyl ester carboxylesterase
MAINDVTVVLVHGAWADGSSWAKVIAPLTASGVKAVAAPLPLTSFHDDIASLDRTLERAQARVVLAGHAYAGAVIGATRSDKVKALVYVAALAPDEGETVAFYRGAPGSPGAEARAGRAWADLPARRGFRHRLCAKRFQRRTGGSGGGAAADFDCLHQRQG